MPKIADYLGEKTRIWGIMTNQRDRITFRVFDAYAKDEMLRNVCKQIVIDGEKTRYWYCEDCPMSSQRIIYANRESQKIALKSHVNTHRRIPDPRKRAGKRSAGISSSTKGVIPAGMSVPFNTGENIPQKVRISEYPDDEIKIEVLDDENEAENEYNIATKSKSPLVPTCVTGSGAGLSALEISDFVLGNAQEMNRLHEENSRLKLQVQALRERVTELEANAIPEEMKKCIQKLYSFI